jgi:hypothetical protein
MNMDDKPITIAEFDTVFEAELARVRLDEAGINASVLGGDLVAMMVPLQHVKVELQVLETNVDRAKEVIETMSSPPQQENDQQQ